MALFLADTDYMVLKHKNRPKRTSCSGKWGEDGYVIYAWPSSVAIFLGAAGFGTPDRKKKIY